LNRQVVLLQTKPFLLFEFSLLFSFCFVEGVREGEFWACFMETRKERGEFLFLRATAFCFFFIKKEKNIREAGNVVCEPHTMKENSTLTLFLYVAAF
jgi:hypothetical protein